VQFQGLASKDQTMRLKKAFLILAFVMVSVIALLYGINPPWFARTFLGVDTLSVNFAHILRAVMCLYLALGCFWLFSAFSDTHRDTAILTTIMFAGGLVIGRLLSFIIDGQPAPLLILYAAVELTIVPIGWWIYVQPDERIDTVKSGSPK
jgi:Na+-driven multidrug efflux pump